MMPKVASACRSLPWRPGRRRLRELRSPQHVINENRRARESWRRTRFDEFETARSVVPAKPPLALIQSVAPEAAQSRPGHGIDEGVHDRTQTVHTATPIRVGDQVAQEVAGAVIRHAGRAALTQDPGDLGHRFFLIGVRDYHFADNAIHARGPERQLFRPGPADGQAGLPPFAGQLRVEVEAHTPAAAGPNPAHLLSRPEADVQ